MVEHVSRRIQFGLIIFMGGASFVVWVVVSSTCSDCDPLRVLAVNDGKLTAFCPVYWQRYHVTSVNDLLLFPGTVLFLSASPLWTNITAAGRACTWRGGTGFL